MLAINFESGMSSSSKEGGEANTLLQEYMAKNPNATQKQLIDFLAASKFFDESTTPGHTNGTGDGHTESSGEVKVEANNNAMDSLNNNITKEDDGTVLDRRDKDIQRGKTSPNYLKYTEFMPVEKRLANHPRTPDREMKGTRNKWITNVKAWRKALHTWTDVEPTEQEKLERTDLDEIKQICEKAASTPAKDVEDENTSLKRGNRGNSKSPIASKQNYDDVTILNDPEFNQLFPMEVSSGKITGHKAFSVPLKKRDLIIVPGKKIPLPEFLQQDPIKLEILPMFKKLVLIGVMRECINLSIPFEQYTKEKIIQVAGEVASGCDSHEYYDACSYILGHPGKITFTMSQLIRIMFGLSRDPKFQQSQTLITTHINRLGENEWKKCSWTNFRMYRTRLFDHLNSQLLKKEWKNNVLSWHVGGKRLPKHVEYTVTKFEMKLDLWFPQFMGEAQTLFKVWLWAVQSEKKFLGKLTPESETALELPPQIKGDQMTFEQKQKLWAWYSKVFTSTPMNMNVNDILEILTALVKTQKKDRIRRRLTDWWSAGYFHHKYNKGALGSVPNLNGVKKSPIKKPPSPQQQMGYPHRRPQMMNRGGLLAHPRGPHPMAMRRGMPLHHHPGMNAARAHLPRGGMPRGRVLHPRGGRMLGPRGMSRANAAAMGFPSQPIPDYYKAGSQY